MTTLLTVEEMNEGRAPSILPAKARSLWIEGKSPSYIDWAMNWKRGTCHDMVVAHWARDKEIYLGRGKDDD